MSTHDSARHAVAFDAFDAMTRAFALLAVGQERSALHFVDEAMADGSFLRIQIAIGAAGPITASLHLVGVDGEADELCKLDPPPAGKPFRLAPLVGRGKLTE